MRALVLVTLVVAPVVLACASKSGTRCSTAADCNGSDEAFAAGRCAPEVACTRDGYCHAACLGTCRVATESRFPEAQCENGGICNQSISSRDSVSDSFRCTNRVIHCRETSDCPIHKPRAEGEWTCEDGTCRFPGHEWAFD
jgi:hypothetical protein